MECHFFNDWLNLQKSSLVEENRRVKYVTKINQMYFLKNGAYKLKPIPKTECAILITTIINFDLDIANFVLI